MPVSKPLSMSGGETGQMMKTHHSDESILQCHGLVFKKNNFERGLIFMRHRPAFYFSELQMKN